MRIISTSAKCYSLFLILKEIAAVGVVLSLSGKHNMYMRVADNLSGRSRATNLILERNRRALSRVINKVLRILLSKYSKSEM